MSDKGNDDDRNEESANKGKPMDKKEFLKRIMQQSDESDAIIVESFRKADENLKKRREQLNNFLEETRAKVKKMDDEMEKAKEDSDTQPPE